MKTETFFRICSPETEQGLWYHFDGTFSGLIHNKFDFCKNTDLKMDFDPELVGWLSATKTLDELYNWFTVEDIQELQKHGWFVHEYETEVSKFYDRFQHFVICQHTSKIVKKHEL